MTADWEQMHQSKEQALQDFNEAKFGIFIHWGAYSLPAGVWKGEKVPGLGEWIMHNAPIPRQPYKKMCSRFNPVKFNAEEWVQAAKMAGMRYIVAMPKHHDGFAMYDSKVTDYDIMDATHFGRDPMDELYRACQKHGVRFLIYYSHATDWMDGGDAGVADYLKTHPEEKQVWPSNTWGYKSYDVDWKSTKELLYWITEITSKGGNYLLNVGPTAEGVFPEESMEQLKVIGDWMGVNGYS